MCTENSDPREGFGSSELESLFRSLPYSVNLTFDRLLSKDDWRIIGANQYRNPRWRLLVSGNSLWIERLGLIIRAGVTRKEDGFWIDSLCVASSEDITKSATRFSRMVAELIDDSLEQGSHLFDEIVFAVVGDVHGHFELMIDSIQNEEARLGRTVDFVLQVGDLMPIRTASDLAYVHGPKKYKRLGDFADYFRGAKRFPWPIYFIGGNHEPYGFLQGFESVAENDGYASICDNLFYLGRVGWAEPFGITVLGLSGIFSPGKHDNERPSEITECNARDFTFFNASDIANIYYTWDSRFADWVNRADVFILHDWPAGLLPNDDLIRLDRKYEHLRTPEHLCWASTIEVSNPRLICCGHHHLRRTYRWNSSNRCMDVHCLADITQGREAVALFCKVNGQIRLITR
jgi:hypothetical protein